MKEKKSMMAIAISKSICKEYSTYSHPRVVYLENGQEFQIQLFNPHKFTIGAEIFINDEKLSNRLVLKPGERVWLERYLDVKKKFKFSTYEVEASDADVQEAIKDNGKIEVKFYREVRKKEWTNYPTITISNYNLNNKEWYNSTTNDFVLDTKSNIVSQVYDTSGLYDTHAYYIKSSNQLNTFEPTASYDLDNCLTSSNDMICETGRIEAGSYSKQDFENVNIDFEYFPFVTEKVKLLPISQKPFTPNDLQKVYCAECGRKLKSNYKFCPYCGTEIE